MKQSSGCSITSSGPLRGALVTLVGALLMSGAAVAAPPTYRIVLLDELARASGSSAEAINNQGYIVGNSFTPNGISHATIWEEPWYVPDGLPALTHHSSAFASAINDWGYTVGSGGLNTGGYLAVSWDGIGALTPLDDLPLGGRVSEASAINNNGIAVGYATDNNRETPVLWTRSGEVERLGTPALGGRAYAVNYHGDAVGYYRDFGNRLRAALWPASDRMRDLGDLPGGPDHSIAYAINDAGQVVGFGYSAGNRQRAVLWNSDGSLTDLGFLADGEGDNYVAIDINEAGVIIGSSSSHQDFLWTAEHGMMDIYDLIEPADPLREQFLNPDTSIKDINSSGVIVGQMQMNPEDPNFHAIMLMPQCPRVKGCY